MVRSEEKPTKAGTGAYLQFTFRITDGPYAGVEIIDRLNHKNPNEIAVQIAMRTLSAICHATNVIHLQSTEQLHGVPLMLRLSVEPGSPRGDGTNYPDQNRIADYMKAGTMPVSEATAMPKESVAPKSDAGLPPWAQ
jgi:hypothetical protein